MRLKRVNVYADFGVSQLHKRVICLKGACLFV